MLEKGAYFVFNRISKSRGNKGIYQASFSEKNQPNQKRFGATELQET